MAMASERAAEGEGKGRKRQRKQPVQERDLRGFKYLKRPRKLLERLHDDATERDYAGNRRLFYDQYAALLLFYFFNPVLDSLRGLQQSTQLKKVQKALGIGRVSLGSLSEAAGVFGAERLEQIVRELSAQARPLSEAKEAELLAGLTAVDGTLLPALPKMVWALWVDEQHRAAKLHLQFEVFKGVPSRAKVTDANSSEKQVLRSMLEPGRLYVMDRGYAEYRLFQEIIDVGSSFICRIRNNADWRLVEERPVSEAARQAGVQRDLLVWLGCSQTASVLRQPLRVVEVAFTDRNGKKVVMLLATNLLELEAELIALGYRYRWAIELFFRWLKCILACRHLLSLSENGVRIQVYLALIASILITLWSGRKPNKRMFERLCFYFLGLATESEVMAELLALPLLANAQDG